MALLILLIALVIITIAWRKAQRRADEAQRSILVLQEEHSAQLAQRTGRAVAASRGNYDGHLAEQAFPAAPHHRYHPKDIFHMGGAIDYLVLDGMHDIRHGQRDPGSLTVVFADVKWGSARASDVQKAVIAAMNEGRTRGETWHAREDPPGQLTYDRRGAL